MNDDELMGGLLQYLKTLIMQGHTEFTPLLNYAETANIFEAINEIGRLLQQYPSNEHVTRLSTLLQLFVLREQSKKLGTRFTLDDSPIYISSLDMVTLPSGEPSVPLSIIIPVKDERENLPILYDELATVLRTLSGAYEIIFIDDGSTDGSTDWLEALPARDKSVRVIVFRRNYGQTAALSAGFKAARGEVVVSLDADLQNDPADIPKLLAKLAEGYDMVCGWRKKRKDFFVTRRIPSLMANWLINKLIKCTGVHLHDFGCSLKAYKIGIVKNIKLYGEMHRFIPVFAAWLGVRITEMEVNHRPRTLGTTKYGLSRVTRVLFDLLPLRFFSDFITRPVQFYGKLAIYLTLLGSFVVLLLALLSTLNVISSTTLIICGMLGVLGVAALIIVCQGILGEISIRQYFETQNKEQYVIKKIVEADPSCAE